jgi:hypothetical protein
MFLASTQLIQCRQRRILHFRFFEKNRELLEIRKIKKKNNKKNHTSGLWKQLIILLISSDLFLNLLLGKRLLNKAANEIPFQRNPRNRLGMVFVIPREKVLLFWNSVCIGIAPSEVRNGTE